MMKRKYFVPIGEKIGYLTVLGTKKGLYECECECGQKTHVKGGYLVQKRVFSCGCRSNPHKDRYLEYFKEKFWGNVQKTASGCWEWLGNKRNGYGRVGYKGKLHTCTRVAWEWVNGKIPEGMFICHKCDNPPCINPEHLFLGNRTQNIRDCFAKGRNKSVLGTKNPNSKLTEENIRKILSCSLSSFEKERLASEFNVNKETIRRIFKMYEISQDNTLVRTKYTV